MKPDDPRALEDLVGERVELRTNAEFGWRGEGYCRVEDGWISVPSALPDELVTVEVEDEVGRGQRAFGRLVEVRQPAAGRVDSHCARVAICRGCQVRTASPALEASFKRERVLELLEKFGGYSRSELPEIGRIGCENARSEGYRWRTNLTYRSDGPQLGLVSGAVDHLITMSDCPSLTTSARRLVGEVEEVLRTPDIPLSGPEGGGHGLRSVRIEAGTPPRIVIVPASPHAGSPGVFAELGERLHARIPDATIAVALDFGVEILHGAPWMTLPYRAAGLPLRALPGAWTHATSEPAEALYRHVGARIAALEPGRHLDVGCAVGAISLLAATHGAEVVGIDSSPDATASAQRNLEGRSAEATFVTADWEKGLRDLFVAGDRFDTATVNPMREPLGARALSYLGKLELERIIYLGPSPEASGRDFVELERLGWKLDRLALADLHPASYQVMVYAEFERG